MITNAQMQSTREYTQWFKAQPRTVPDPQWEQLADMAYRWVRVWRIIERMWRMARSRSKPCGSYVDDSRMARITRFEFLLKGETDTLSVAMEELVTWEITYEFADELKRTFRGELVAAIKLGPLFAVMRRSDGSTYMRVRMQWSDVWISSD